METQAQQDRYIAELFAFLWLWQPVTGLAPVQYCHRYPIAFLSKHISHQDKQLLLRLICLSGPILVENTPESCKFWNGLNAAPLAPVNSGEVL